MKKNNKIAKAKEIDKVKSIKKSVSVKQDRTNPPPKIELKPKHKPK